MGQPALVRAGIATKGETVFYFILTFIAGIAIGLTLGWLEVYKTVEAKRGKRSVQVLKQTVTYISKGQPSSTEHVVFRVPEQMGKHFVMAKEDFSELYKD